MIIKIILIALFLVIGFVAYKFFSGIAKEDRQAQDTLLKETEVEDEGKYLLESEYEKLNNGEYDEALDNINSFLIELREESKELVEEITNWEKRKEEWNQNKNNLKESIDFSLGFANEEVRKAVEDLVREGKELRAEGESLKGEAE